MSVSNVVLSIITVSWAAAQYALAINALRDLVRRARVRGGNRMMWAIVILCVPVFGPLVYSWNGPMSLRQHDPVSTPFDLDDELLSYINDSLETHPANVTPLHPPMRGTISGRSPAQRRGLTRSRAHNVNTSVRPTRRPGA